MPEARTIIECGPSWPTATVFKSNNAYYAYVLTVLLKSKQCILYSQYYNMSSQSDYCNCFGIVETLSPSRDRLDHLVRLDRRSRSRGIQYISFDRGVTVQARNQENPTFSDRLPWPPQTPTLSHTVPVHAIYPKPFFFQRRPQRSCNRHLFRKEDRIIKSRA